MDTAVSTVIETSSSLRNRVRDVHVDYEIIGKFKHHLLPTIWAAFQKFERKSNDTESARNAQAEIQDLWLQQLAETEASPPPRIAGLREKFLAKLEVSDLKTSDRTDGQLHQLYSHSLIPEVGKRARENRPNYLNSLQHTQAVDVLVRTIELMWAPKRFGLTENERVFAPAFRKAVASIFSDPEQAYLRILNFPDKDDPAQADFLAVREQIIEKLVAAMQPEETHATGLIASTASATGRVTNGVASHLNGSTSTTNGAPIVSVSETKIILPDRRDQASAQL